MPRPYYQVATLTIVDDYRMHDFVTYRKDWWNDRLHPLSGFQHLFSVTTCKHNNGTYHVEVVAYRRNTDSPHVGKVA
jgi:hypothetical protein